MRLVDADEIKKREQDVVLANGAKHRCFDTTMLFEIPTVDAVEVVRCKDCKFSHMTYSGECKSCDKWVDDDDFHLTLYLDGDFYCAWGERREDGQ